MAVVRIPTNEARVIFIRPSSEVCGVRPVFTQYKHWICDQNGKYEAIRKYEDDASCMNRARSSVSIVTVQAMSSGIQPRTSTLSNGLQLVTERNEGQKSASFCWLIPGGVAHDPLDRGDGWASMISEYLLRGADDLSSREFSEALDRIGARRSVIADSYFIRASVTVCGENIAPAISLFVKMILRAHFAPDVIEPVRSLSMQELNGLDDDPSQQSLIRLDSIRLPKPFDRHGLGFADHIMATTSQDLKDHFQSP